MQKCKIVVYAISKNEAQFVNRWVDSMQEADEIYVLDTGSTDNTVELLKKRNVHVKKKKITPWRFDVARNESLKMLPKDADICACIDLDEVFEKNWAEKLRKLWNKKDNTRYRYTYNWKLNSKNIPLVSYRQDKIHSLKSYYWTHPVHEVLKTDGKETYVETTITLNHYPDCQKSRQSYLPLLELSVKENPEDDRNLHYLGREYMFYKKYDESIKTLHQHIKCKNATWKDERSASMRFLARCYIGKEYFEEAEFWYLKAINEAPYLKEAYVELSSLYQNQNRYQEALKYINEALKIKEKSNSYINEEFAWNDAFYDLVSIIYYYTNQKQKAIEFLQKAISINPDNQRYQENLKIMQQATSHE